MANGRKLEDSRQLADEELHVKLEQYRLETHRFQADFIRAQMEAQRLQHCLDEALRDRGRAEQDFQMKTRMLESRCCAAEEALSTLRSSLPILEVGDKALDTVRLELATSGAEQSEGKGMRRRQEEVVRRTEGETQPRAGEVHQRTEMDLSIELAREVGKSQVSCLSAFVCVPAGLNFRCEQMRTHQPNAETGAQTAARAGKGQGTRARARATEEARTCQTSTTGNGTGGRAPV
jgi:hypothetical protein